MNPTTHLKTLEEAFSVGENVLKSTKSNKLPIGLAPWHIQQGGLPWEMSIPALENTLNYVMNHLHHPCYMLCISPTPTGIKRKQLFKLETGKTAPVVLDAIANAKTRNTASKVRRDEIVKDIQTGRNAYRIMQCIVKPFTQDFSSEFEEWTKTWPLPPGVYLLNLTDAILLRKDSREPFPNAYAGTGSIPKVGIKLSPMLPILSLSAHEDYYDIPIPNYDDLFYTLPLSDSNKSHKDYAVLHDAVAQFKTRWSDKVIDKAVFRGSSTGCGVTEETNARLRLMSMKHDKVDWLDVGFTAGKSHDKFDPVHGFALSRRIPKDELVARLPMAKQSEYKYLIHIDGNVLAYRLLFSLLTGSLLLRVKSPYQSFVDTTGLLKPGVHYLPIESDLSNLQETVEWCRKHDKESALMAKRGRELAEEILTPRFLNIYYRNIFQFYIKNSSKKSRKGGSRRKKKPFHIRMTRSTRKRRLSS